ncbi:MAG: hypothetical protein U0528_01330 [Anaerolineae bacterium]
MAPHACGMWRQATTQIIAQWDSLIIAARFAPDGKESCTAGPWWTLAVAPSPVIQRL